MKIISLETVDSTNEYAKKIISESENFTVIRSKKQTKGKGRLDRRWESPEGGLWISIILKPDFFSSLLSLISALAVFKTLKKFDFSPELKWPNDVIVSGRKICGILLERSFESVIVGMGLNVNIKKLNVENWTSMFLEKKKKFNLNEVLNVLISNMRYYYKLYEKKEFSKIIEEWKQNSYTLGKNVMIETSSQSISGKAVDIDENGFLILDNGKKINAGDVIHLR